MCHALGIRIRTEQATLLLGCCDNLLLFAGKENRLRRIFTAFPRGRQGAGLLLIRAVTGLAAIVQGVSFVYAGGPAAWERTAAGVCMASAGLLLLIGFLTPLAAVAAGLSFGAAALFSAEGSGLNLFDCRPAVFFGVSMTVAAVFLGPGAYSADARLFGPHEILIPPVHRPQD